MTRKTPIPFALVLAAACSSKAESPQPSVTSIAPRAICAEQLTSTVALSGMHLSAVPSGVLSDAPGLLLPSVTLQRSKDLSGNAAGDAPIILRDDPNQPKNSAVRWMSASSLVFTVSPADGLMPGLYTIRVGALGGKNAELPDALLALSRPRLERADPDLLCGARENMMTLSGQNFVKTDGGALPRVQIDDAIVTANAIDDCHPLAGSAGFESCRTLRVQVPAQSVNAGAHKVAVINPAPAACSTTENVMIQAIANPKIDSLTPDLVCPTDPPAHVALHGEGFLVADGNRPRIRLGMLDVAGTGSDCTPVTGVREDATLCKTLTATLGDSVTPGNASVSVTNPGPADCTSSPGPMLTVDARPTVTRVLTDLVCDSGQMRVLRIMGTNFAEVADPGHAAREPRVDLVDSSSTATPLTMVMTSSCADVPGPASERRRTCTEVLARLPADVLSDGAYKVVVTNPAPLSCGSRENYDLVSVPAPDAMRVRNPLICRDAPDRTLRIEGTGFVALRNGGAYSAVPRVTVTQGSTVLLFGDPRPQNAFSVRPAYCDSIAGVAEDAQSCRELAITLPPNLPFGMYSAGVTNPDQTDCTSANQAGFMVTPPPMIAGMGVMPQALCVQGGALSISGSGFVSGAVASIGGIAADSTSVANGGTTVTATWGSLGGLTVNQQYPVTVLNPDGCTALAATHVRLTEGPAVYFADPPIVYGGISTRLTVYTAPIQSRPITVRLRRQGSTDQLLFQDTDVTFDPVHPNRVSVVIPRSTALQPVNAGTYDVSVADVSGCENTILGGLSVSDRLELGLTGISPSLGYYGDNPEVQLFARASSTTSPPREPFLQTPRAYLSPVNGGVSTPLRSVAFVDDHAPPMSATSTLTAVAPNGLTQLAIGGYDVVVVNPDGAVGVLSGGFQVTAFPAPSISTLVPGSILPSAGQAVQVQGAGFVLDPACTSGCVRITCRTPGAAAPAATIPATVSNPQSTSINLTIDASSVVPGTACVLRVINQDGNFGEISSLTIADPASNTVPLAFRAQAPLVTGRRAAAAVGVNAGPGASFIYALGGDRGSDATAVAAVEAARVGAYGDLGPWFRIPLDLPDPRTRAGAVRVGRFIYLVGGSVPATGPSNAVLRAMVLDPAAVPVMNEEDFLVTPNTTGGLPPGDYYYRISVIRPPNDRGNPNGETLSSEPLVAHVPSSAGNRVSVRVSWQAVPGANGYRLYRTAMPGLIAGDERLICSFPAAATAYQDNNDPMNDTPPCVGDPTAAPLPLGSTGVWHTEFPDAMNMLATRSMAAARASPGLTVATDRANPTFHHIYAVGGSGAASLLGTYEHLTVLAGSPTAQTIAADWVTGAQNPTARSELAAVAADPSNAATTGTNACVFALGGRIGAAQSTGLVEVALLPPMGAELGPWSSTFGGPGPSAVPGLPAGSTSVLANSTIYVFGGALTGGTTPDGSVQSRTLTGAGSPCSTFLGPWNSLPSTGFRARYLAGTAAIGGFVYILGGSVSQPAATCGDGTTDVAGSSCIVDGSVLGGQP